MTLSFPLLAAALFLPLLATGSNAASLTLSALVTDASLGRTAGVHASPPTGSSRSYMLRLGGTVDIWETGGATPYRIGRRLLNETNRPSGLAQAYGLAFAPDFDSSGHVYLSYSDDKARNKLVRYTAQSRKNGEMYLDAATRETMLVINSATGRKIGSHFGGAIGFGPDGHLYMTTGDPHADPTGMNVAQDTGSLLGKVLRIDPTGDDFPGNKSRNYAIPSDNPDFGRNARPELWAIGLRNPYRASFDALTGRYFLPDVGETKREELNIGEAGANYAGRPWRAACPSAAV